MEFLSGIFVRAIGTFLGNKAFSYAERKCTSIGEDELKVLFNDSFDRVFTFLEERKALHSNASRLQREELLKRIKRTLKFKNGMYHFREGDLENQLLDRLIPSKEQRIKKFLTFAFFYIGGNEGKTTFILACERVLVFLRKKFTAYHYVSIHNWHELTMQQLLDGVKDVEVIDKYWNENFVLPKPTEIKKKPAIQESLKKVLASGKVSEKTVFNLAAAEKILIVIKYGEGFSAVYKLQSDELNRLKKLLEKYEANKKSNKDKIEKTKAKISKLKNNWITTPIGAVLEKHGFCKLFSKMNGVYFYPLSMLPEKYHNNHELFLSEVIIKEAAQYLSKVKKLKKVAENFEGGLKYLVLSHVIPVSRINILKSERDLEFSSSAFSRLLLTSYLSKENGLTNFYINDLVRNVDIREMMNTESKTGGYIIKNFDILKKLLWDTCKVDVYKPISLISLTEGNIEEICRKMIEKDDAAKLHLLRNELKKIVKFYKELDQELNSIKA